MDAFVTVQHSGTMFCLQHIIPKGTPFAHFTGNDFDMMLAEHDIDRFITTVRNPYTHAASYANRGFRPGKVDIKLRQLMGQFNNWYHKVFNKPETKVLVFEEFTRGRPSINEVADSSGAKAAYFKKDWDHYFSIIPESIINDLLSHDIGYQREH